MLRLPLRISLFALALLACAAPAAAQTLHGRLTSQDGGRPVGGALVALVDADGREVRTTVSSSGCGGAEVRRCGSAGVRECGR
jgi:hypothetical protein